MSLHTAHVLVGRIGALYMYPWNYSHTVYSISEVLLKLLSLHAACIYYAG